MKKSKNWTDNLPAFIFDPTLDAKKRSQLIEKEMNEQAKIINDLRSLGASHGTIEQEMKRLHELEAMVFKDFRRYVVNFFFFFLYRFWLLKFIFQRYDTKVKEAIG